MKTQAIDWHCKMCRKPIVIHASLECPIDWAESLAKMVCCNRCHDFRDASETCGSKIVASCARLQSLRYGKTLDPAKEKIIAETLTYLTKAYCRIASAYFNVNNIWHEDFVNLLMERPDQAGDALRSMNFHLRKTRPVHESLLLPESRPVSPDPRSL